MPFKKGQSGNDKGRPKGAENNETKALRIALKTFVEGNTDRMQEWLDRVAETNPQHALYILDKFAEYSIPKLQRTMINDETPNKQLTIRVIDGNSSDKDIHSE